MSSNGSPVTTTTPLPDLTVDDITPIDASVEDQLAVPRPGTLNNGDYRFEYRDSDVSAWTFNETLAYNGLASSTITGLLDGEKYDIRVRQETEDVTGDYVQVSVITLLPAPTDLTLVGREDTVTGEWVDNADNENQTILQVNTDSGWVVVDTVGANITTANDSSPTYYETQTYRVQTQTEYVVSNSNTDSTIPVRGGTPYAEFGGVIILPEHLTAASVQPEHTAIWGCTLGVGPGSSDALDSARDPLQLYYGDHRYFDGYGTRVKNRFGDVRIQGEGKEIDLREETRTVTYPGEITSQGAIPVSDCLRDYWDKTGHSVSVADAAVTPVKESEAFYDAPTVNTFPSVFDLDASTPVVVDSSGVRLAQSCWFTEVEDIATQGSVESRPDASGAAAQVLNSTGQEFTVEFTPEYRIPSGDFDCQVRFEEREFEGRINVLLDGNLIAFLPRSGPYTSTGYGWGLSKNLDLPGTVNSIPDLAAGETHSLTIQIQSLTNGDVSFDVAAPYDTGDRAGGYNYTFDNSVSNELLVGPEPHPDSVTIQATADEIWHTNAAAITSTWNNTANSQRIALSPNGSKFTAANNTTALSADFNSLGYYGTDAVAELTFSRYDETRSFSPTQGTGRQEMSEFQLTVSTDTQPLITSESSVTLQADSDLRNLQDLHAGGDYRFVLDHSQDGIVGESFQRGDPDKAKAGSWTSNYESVSYERDMSDYANQLYAVGDGTTRTVRVPSEVSEEGVIQVARSYPQTSDATELTANARRELIQLTSNDSVSGGFEVAPEFFLPGYPYTVPEFGGIQANLNRVQFELLGETTSLEFGRLEGLVPALDS